MTNMPTVEVSLHEASEEINTPQGKDVETTTPPNKNQTGNKEPEAKTSGSPVVLMVDASTQTEDDYFDQPEKSPQPPPSQPPQHADSKKKVTSSEKPTDLSHQDTATAQSPIDVLTAKMYKLPLIDSPQTKDIAKKSPPRDGIQLSKRVGGHSLVTETQDMLSLQCSASKQQPQRQSVSKKLHSMSKTQKGELLEGYVSSPIPRTVESTRRMLKVFNEYSHTNAQKQFHQQYQEVSPDLRPFGMRKGKRHVIHGAHAYYYH